jgi:SAM-dependent methyltransferase
MDRAGWLRDRREAVRAEYDLEAPGYDANPYPATSHRRFVDRLVAGVPIGGTILDAPCGTGRYFQAVTDAGRRVVGIDQSAGMLQAAQARGLADRLEQVGLQELAFRAEFDAALTIDAMENVPPEDWPLVLGNLVRAVRPGSPLYMTVEEVAEVDIDAAFRAARAAGQPAIRGEVVEGDAAGYHYYPGRDRVRSWLAEAGLSIIDEMTDQEDGWAYWHLLLNTPT